MITLRYTEEETMALDSLYPNVDLEVEFDNDGLSWPEMMKVFARQLPKMGYILNVELLEEMIEEAAQLNRREILEMTMSSSNPWELLREAQREEKATTLAAQVGGGHYKDLPIQPVEYIHKNGIPFIEGCIIKYATRWRAKGGKEDIKKIIHFAEMLLELEDDL